MSEKKCYCECELPIWDFKWDCVKCGMPVTAQRMSEVFESAT